MEGIVTVFHLCKRESKEEKVGGIYRRVCNTIYLDNGDGFIKVKKK